MLDSIISIASATTSAITPAYLLICTLASLAFGLGSAFIYMYRNNYSKNFVVTLALLPSMIQLVIMVVNGNLGAGVAVMGAFSLVRFRSIPGSAKDIGSIFFSMAIGLANGMGYITVAFLFLVIVGLATLILNTLSFGEQKRIEKELKITIPENLDYTGLFDDIFARYTADAELVRVKTTNMGSLYELTYRIVLGNQEIEKSFLDELRCRNGNLNILCGRVSTQRDEL